MVRTSCAEIFVDDVQDGHETPGGLSQQNRSFYSDKTLKLDQRINSGRYNFKREICCIRTVNIYGIEMQS